MDLGRSPERVLKAHTSDQVANLPIDPRSATERTGLPSPVSGEPQSVSSHDRLGPDDGYGVQGARSGHKAKRTESDPPNANTVDVARAVRSTFS